MSMSTSQAPVYALSGMGSHRRRVKGNGKSNSNLLDLLRVVRQSNLISGNFINNFLRMRLGAGHRASTTRRLLLPLTSTVLCGAVFSVDRRYQVGFCEGLFGLGKKFDPRPSLPTLVQHLSFQIFNFPFRLLDSLPFFLHKRPGHGLSGPRPRSRSLSDR